MTTFKAIKSHLKQLYDKQNLTLVVISYEMTTRVRSSMYKYTTSYLSYDVASESVIKLCIRNDNQLVD